MSHSLAPTIRTSDYQVYLVGGAIRDALIGKFASDCDFVVVGATPEIMLAEGFRPVGRDFPVFLHPKTKQEYALARSEKKNGYGYHGFNFYFAPDVSLIDDLARRDLTINAMALHLPRNFDSAYLDKILQDKNLAGQIIDPYNGKLDLKNKIFRHVSSAFSDDPVRLLRLARFSCKFSDFKIASETIDLINQMQLNGELQFLQQERVWQEYTRAMDEKLPANFFRLLIHTNTLIDIFPALVELETTIGEQILQLIDTARNEKISLQFSLLSTILYWKDVIKLFDKSNLSTKQTIFINNEIDENSIKYIINKVEDFCQQLKADNSSKELALMLAKNFKYLWLLPKNAEEWLDFLIQTDVLRRPERFELFICLLEYLQAIIIEQISVLNNFSPDITEIKNNSVVLYKNLIEKLIISLKNINYQNITQANYSNKASAIKSFKISTIQQIINEYSF